jgi:hypothetical protein
VRCSDYLRREVFGRIYTSLESIDSKLCLRHGSAAAWRLQDGIDAVLKLKAVSAWPRFRLHRDATYELVDHFGRTFQGELVHLGRVALGRFRL